MGEPACHLELNGSSSSSDLPGSAAGGAAAGAPAGEAAINLSPDNSRTPCPGAAVATFGKREEEKSPADPEEINRS